MHSRLTQLLSSKTRTLFLVCIVPLAMLIVAGCGSSSSSSSPAATSAASTTAGSSEASGEPLVVGLALAETGFMSAYDPGDKVTIEMAAEKINEEGGVEGRPIELVSANSQSTPEGSASAGLSVLNKGADFVITSGDYDVGGPACVQAQKAGVACISAGAASSKFGPSGIGPLAFTTATAATGEASAMAEWAYEKHHIHNVYMLEGKGLAFTEEIAQGFEARWKSLGGEIVGHDVLQAEEQSIASQISRIKALPEEPEAIYLAALPATALKQLRAAGIETAILAPESYDGEAWKSAVPHLGNFYFSTYNSLYGNDPEPRINQFFKEYDKRTGGLAPYGGVTAGYSAVEAFVDAYEATGSTEGAAIGAALEEFDNKKLLIGPTTFTSEDHITYVRDVRIMEIKNGKTHFVAISRPSDVPTL